MQQLQLLSVGVGLAWVAQQASRLAGQSAATSAEAAEAAHPDENNQESDFEQRATQWLSRKAVSVGGNAGDTPVAHASSYSEVELLVDGELVYLRSGSNVLTALVPTVRRLNLQPLQLTKGKTDAVPTAPLDPNSVWLVRRHKQEVVFELSGPQGRRLVLEADPGSPHGVALGGGHVNRRGRWHITPQGLTSARWPQHVLPLQVLPVQLVDARALSSVKASLGRQLSEQAARAEREARERAQADARREEVEAQLGKAQEASKAQISELRVHLEVANRCRHAAEREMAALQAQRTDDHMRTKAAQAKAAQAEQEAQQLTGTLRQLQKQMQGLLAEHSDELATLRQELQIARETNEGLQRAMKEQMLSLKGELELRDARILELEEENDRMDTVLQVIQAQLGSGGLAFPQPTESAAADGAPAGEEQPAPGGGPAAAEADGEEAADAPVSASCDAREAAPEPSVGGEISLAGPEQRSVEVEQRAQAAAGEEPPLPLWRSLLDLPGGLTVTALKESLAISRRSTADNAIAMFPSAEPALARADPERQYAQASRRGTADPEEEVSSSTVGLHGGGAAATTPTNSALRAWPFVLSPDRASSVGSSDGRELAAWGSRDVNGPGGGGGGGFGDEDGGFVSAAERMGGSVRGAPGPSAAGVPASASASSSAQPSPARAAKGGAAGGAGRWGTSEAPRDAVMGAGAAATASIADSRLQSGFEALQELDVLRRRLRELDLERQRLQLVSCSLEGSLPWRANGAAGATAGPVADGGGGVGVGPVRSSGARVREDGGVGATAAAGRSTAEAVALTAGVQGWLRAAEAAGEETGWARSRRPAASAASLEAGPDSSLVAGRRMADRSASACVEGAARAGSASVSNVRRIAQQLSAGGHERNDALPPLLPRGGCGGAARQAALGTIVKESAASAALTNGLGSRYDAGDVSPSPRSEGGPASSPDRLPGRESTGGEPAEGTPSPAGQAERSPPSNSSSPHTSTGGDGDTSLSGSGSSGITPGSGLRVQVTGSSSRAGLMLPLTAGWIAGAPSGAAAAGRFVPELRLKRPSMANGTDVYGVMDSMDGDGMCNLGSTRAVPTARGAAGMLTARHFSHSRRPSTGVGGGVLGGDAPAAHVAVSAAAGAVVAALSDEPDTSEDADRRPQTPTSHRTAVSPPSAAGTPPPVAAVASRLAATPKSVAGEPAADDDAAVHCDDQEEGSPPVAMLLGTLEALRGAGAAGAGGAEGGKGACGGLRAGKRGLAALEEEDDDDDDA